MIIKVSQTFDSQKLGIPTGSEKYVAFTNDKNLFFIDSMQLMNSNLDTLVKNLSEDRFKYLSQTFSGNLLN